MAEGNDDDPFESIAFIEDKIYSKGFTSGYAEGSDRGQHEGLRSGYEKGTQIGEEVAFYLGFTETWLSLLAKDNGKTDKNEKLIRLLNGLSEAVLSFHIFGIHHENYFNQVEQFRSKYKQITSLLKISTEYQNKSSLNF